MQCRQASGVRMGCPEALGSAPMTRSFCSSFIPKVDHPRLTPFIYRDATFPGYLVVISPLNYVNFLGKEVDYKVDGRLQLKPAS